MNSGGDAELAREEARRRTVGEEWGWAVEGGATARARRKGADTRIRQTHFHLAKLFV